MARLGDAWRAARREWSGEARRVGPEHRERLRRRLDAVETEILELLADEKVPARGRRLDALGRARDDLRGALAGEQAC